MNKEQLIQLAECKLYTKSIQHDSANVTVVMDAGYGDDSTAWSPLVADIRSWLTSSCMIELALGKVKPARTHERVEI